jgi:glycerate kinase
MSEIVDAPCRVLIAPDSFKGSAAATEVAGALADGWLACRPHDAVRVMPMADGGEGTLDAVESAVACAQRRAVVVPGPEGESLGAHWLLLPDGTGVVELAVTSGLTLSPQRAPFRAHTLGFGKAIVAALEAGAGKLLLAIGGSASTDGGTGALSALGARFVRADGSPIALGNGGLAELADVDLSGLAPLPPGGVDVLTDVTNPLLGELGAAAVFGPQKGAAPEDIERLERNLRILVRHIGVDPATPGAGAAGGTGFGLLAWGARLVAGSDAIGRLLGVPDAVRDSDVVITGEGRFDGQSTAGKVAGYLGRLARERNTASFLVAGRIDAPTEQLFAAAESLQDIAADGDAMTRPIEYLRQAGSRLAERWRREHLDSGT